MAIKKIAFIGLGAMGYPMAKRLCEAGFELHVTLTESNRERVKALQEKGAKVSDSYWASAKDADLILTILPEDAQVNEVLLNKDFYDAIKKEAIILEMTSCSARTVKDVEQYYRSKGVRVFDAPVSGGTAGAEKGTLTIFGSGSEDVLKEITPVFDVLAGKVYHVGDLGAGKALKTVNQMLVAMNMAAVAEAYSLALNEGIDLDMMQDVISASTGTSFVFDKKFVNVIKDSFQGGFKLRLMRKDLKTALKTGENIPLPLTRLVYAFFLMASKYDELDYSVMGKFFAEGLAVNNQTLEENEK